MSQRHPKGTLTKKKIVEERVVRQRPAKAARTRRNRTKQSGAQTALKGYTNTLSDPFDYGPIPLGFDTMCATNMVTAYYRGTSSPHSDGSIALTLTPSVFDMVMTNVAGWNVATWTKFNAANSSAISSYFKTGRVISGGLRCFVAQAATDRPGSVVCSTQADLAEDDISGTTPNNVYNFQGGILGPSVRGCAGMLRPIDSIAYQFANESVQGYLSSNIAQGWCLPMICFQGLPASAVVHVEAVLNIECLAKSAASFGQNRPGTSLLSKTLSDYFPSSEALAKAAMQIASSPVIMDAAANIAAQVHPALGGAVSLVGRIGNGTANSRSLQGYLPASSVTIEEIPEIPVPRLRHDEL